MNAVEHILQGKSDRATAEVVGVTRQTINEWRNNDVLFIATLNRERSDLWKESRERLKDLTSQAVDVLEVQLVSEDPKIALAAARHILQGNKLLGGSDVLKVGLTSPEAIIMERLRSEARRELAEEERQNMPRYPLEFDPLREIHENDFNNRVEDLARSRLQKAMVEAGLLVESG
jgi:DNA-binding XRE family transcriptional regulator